MDRLKLVALDAEDLAVLSAHLQDAVVRVGDLRFLAEEGRFVIALNRFAWETTGRRGPDERRRAVLHFDRVKRAQATRIRREAPDAVLSLLAVTFEPGEAPAGTVRLAFSGGAEMRLEVEYVEARLADLGAAWAARGRPSHDAAGKG